MGTYILEKNCLSMFYFDWYLGKINEKKYLWWYWYVNQFQRAYTVSDLKSNVQLIMTVWISANYDIISIFVAFAQN